MVAHKLLPHSKLGACMADASTDIDGSNSRQVRTQYTHACGILKYRQTTSYLKAVKHAYIAGTTSKVSP
jgi:hypothetical protein